MGFTSPRNRKYPNGLRTNRASRAGYWKATRKDRAVHSGKRAVGMKKTSVYYKERAPRGIRTDWRCMSIASYSLLQKLSHTLQDSYALCRVFKKNMVVPKPKEALDRLSRDNNDISSAETSRGETAYDENMIKDHEMSSKFDPSSSELIQWTICSLTSNPMKSAALSINFI